MGQNRSLYRCGVSRVRGPGPALLVHRHLGQKWHRAQCLAAHPLSPHLQLGELPKRSVFVDLYARSAQQHDHRHHHDVTGLVLWHPVRLCGGAHEVPRQIAGAGDHPVGGHHPADRHGGAALRDLHRPAAHLQHVCRPDHPRPGADLADHGVVHDLVFPRSAARPGRGGAGRWGHAHACAVGSDCAADRPWGLRGSHPLVHRGVERLPLWLDADDR